MNLRTTLFTILLVTGIGIQSCSDNECDCCTSGEYKGFFDIQDMQVKHWNTDFNTIESSEIQFEEYGYINLHFIVDYIVHEPNSAFNFSLINAAYGCTPVPPGQEGSKEEAITSLKIITVNDFDADHKAGESINDLLELTDIFFGEAPILLTDYLSNTPENVPSEYFVLRILEEPTTSQDFQIKVTINLSTSEQYEATSEAIKFI